MAETVEKIYCTEPYNNNDALLATLANQNGVNNPAAMMALMNNGGMGMWNNPFIYLVWMMFARRMYGDENGNNVNSFQNAAIQDQIMSLRNQITDNQNSNQLMDAITHNGTDVRTLAANLNCDYNALSGAICDVRASIDKVAGQVGFSAERVINAVNLGDQNIVQQLQNCCCQTKTVIQQMGYENQLANERQTGILGSKIDNNTHSISSQLASNFAANQLQSCQYQGQTINKIDQLIGGIQTGFATIGYQAAKDKTDIIDAINASQQRTADQLNNHWTLELSQKLQDAKFEISQLKQNQYLGNLINGGCACNGN